MSSIDIRDVVLNRINTGVAELRNLVFFVVTPSLCCCRATIDADDFC